MSCVSEREREEFGKKMERTWKGEKKRDKELEKKMESHPQV